MNHPMEAWLESDAHSAMRSLQDDFETLPPGEERADLDIDQTVQLICALGLVIIFW
jgi:hypothetical protein